MNHPEFRNSHNPHTQRFWNVLHKKTMPRRSRNALAVASTTERQASDVKSTTGEKQPMKADRKDTSTTGEKQPMKADRKDTSTTGVSQPSLDGKRTAKANSKNNTVTKNDEKEDVELSEDAARFKRHRLQKEKERLFLRDWFLMLARENRYGHCRSALFKLDPNTQTWIDQKRSIDEWIYQEGDTSIPLFMALYGHAASFKNLCDTLSKYQGSDFPEIL